MTDGSDWFREVIAKRGGRPVGEPEPKAEADDAQQEVETDR